MSIEQNHVAPANAEIVDERTRRIQNFIIAIGLKLPEGIAEGVKASNGEVFTTAYFADPESIEFWRLEYKGTPDEGKVYSAIKLRVTQYGKVMPSENTFSVKDGTIIQTMRRRLIAFEPQNFYVQDDRILSLEQTVLRLRPLSIEEKRLVRDLE